MNEESAEPRGAPKHDPLSPRERGEGRGEGRGGLAAAVTRPAPHPDLLPVNGEKGRTSAHGVARHDLARVFRFVSTLALIAALAPAPARADVEADKAAIMARLQAWTDAFNARDAARTCDLFSKDLVSTMRGRADEGREAVCRRIGAALADHMTKLTYAPDIEEIMVSGDLAVVRLVWSVTLQRGPKPATSKEPGVDIFQREADGQWRIVRFLAFSNAPD